MFVVSFIALGYLGTQPATPTATIVARFFTAIYFGFFLLMPLYTRWEKTKPVPKRLTAAHSLEEQLEHLPELIEEITQIKHGSSEIGHPAFKSSFFNIRPNPTGIKNVISRLAKKAKGSLD
jgi:ubiquinol-cytochrome c reductase cytochrome b subunit